MMDLFDSMAKMAQDFGENVVNSAKSVGEFIRYSTAEQREIAGLRMQIDNIDKKLEIYYAAIGKRYVEYVRSLNTEESFNVEDILQQINEELTTKSNAEIAISEKVQLQKEEKDSKEKTVALEKFNAEMKKLDEALHMGIITTDEYNEKLEKAQKKLDNYAELNRFEQQLRMQIITKEEYDAKVKELLR